MMMMKKKKNVDEFWFWSEKAFWVIVEESLDITVVMVIVKILLRSSQLTI